MKLFTIIALAFALCGCDFIGKPKLGCNETPVKELVAKVYMQQLDAAVDRMERAVGKVDYVTAKKAMSINIEGVRTESVDEKTGKHICRADMIIKVPTGVMQELGTGTGTFFGASSRKGELALVPDGFKAPIQYTSQATDDNKSYYVEAFGLDALVNGGLVIVRHGKFSKTDTSEKSTSQSDQKKQVTENTQSKKETENLIPKAFHGTWAEKPEYCEGDNVISISANGYTGYEFGCELKNMISWLDDIFTAEFSCNSDGGEYQDKVTFIIKENGSLKIGKENKEIKKC